MRQSPQLEWSSQTQLLITWLGGLSALQGAACGIQENDLKRVIAFSTTSQQGYMVMACGQSQYSLSLFHLINHAFFKAQLFQSAGAVIHALADQQDMRKMGSQVLFLPYTYAMILLGSQSLMAFPFQTGFYSKDLILELAQVPHNFSRTIAYILALLAAFLSATYSVRLIIMTFISRPHFPLTLVPFIAEPSFFMLIPLFLLSLGSAIFGYLTQDLFLGQGSTFYLQALFTHPNHIGIQDGSLSEASLYKFLPLQTLLILQFAIPFTPNVSLFNTTKLNPNNNLPLYSNNLGSESIERPILELDSTLKNRKIVNINLYTSILNHFNIFTHWIIYTFLVIGHSILRYWDRGLVEIQGPLGLVKLFHLISFKLESPATGHLIKYASFIIQIPQFFLLFSYFNLILLLIVFILVYIFYNN